MKNLFTLLFILSCAFVGYSQEWNYSYRQGKLDINSSSTQVTGLFGASLAKCGSILLVGDGWEHYDTTGQNYLYRSGAVYSLVENPLSGWQQVQKITAPVRHINHEFGNKIEVVDSFLFVASSLDSWDENESNYLLRAGGVFVYKLNSLGDWIYWQKIVAYDREAWDGFGVEIKSNSSSIFISSGSRYDAQGANPILYAGKVYEYKLGGNGFWQLNSQIVANVRTSGSYYGWEVDVNDSILVVSDFFNNYDGNEQNFVGHAGAVFIYKLDSMQSWQFAYKLTDSIRILNDYFGSKLLLLDDKLIIAKQVIIPFSPIFLELVTFRDTTGNGDFGFTQRLELYDTSPYNEEFHFGFNEVFIGSRENNHVKRLELLNDTLIETQTIINCMGDTSLFGHSLLNWNNKLLIGSPWGDSLGIGIPQGSFAEFELCISPTLTGLSLDTVSSCQGTVLVSIDSSSNLGDTQTWGLYFGTTTDSLLATDSTGNFNIQLTEPGYYSISAIGSCNAMCKQIESFYFQFDTLYSSVQIVACDSEYVLNQWVTTSTTLYDTLSSVSGCDSIAVFDVTILNPTVTNEDIFGCDSLFFDGLWFNSNSTHSSTFVGMNGCDSVVNYSIYLQNTQHFFDTVYGLDSALVYGQWVYSYGWYDTVFTSAFGCDSIYHYWVELGANFGLLFNTTNEVFGADGMIDLMVIGGVGPYTYDWDIDGVGDADDSEDLSGLTAGTYSVIVVDKYGKVTSGSAVVGNSLSVSELSTQSASVYPNPTNGMLNISVLESQIDEIQLFSVLGEILISKRLQNSKNVNLDLSELSSGIYFLEIKNSNKETFTQRIIKE